MREKERKKANERVIERQECLKRGRGDPNLNLVNYFHEPFLPTRDPDPDGRRLVIKCLLYIPIMTKPGHVNYRKMHFYSYTSAYEHMRWFQSWFQSQAFSMIRTLKISWVSLGTELDARGTSRWFCHKIQVHTVRISCGVLILSFSPSLFIIQESGA